MFQTTAGKCSYGQLDHQNVDQDFSRPTLPIPSMSIDHVSRDDLDNNTNNGVTPVEPNVSLPDWISTSYKITLIVVMVQRIANKSEFNWNLNGVQSTIFFSM